MAKHLLHKARLKEKGWSDAEIAHAEAVFERAEEKKHPNVVMLDQVVYWLLLLISLVGVVIVTAVIVPLILLLPPSMVAVVLLILGVAFGALFTIVIQDIHWLQGHHHSIALVFLPVISVLAFLFVPLFSEKVVHVHAPSATWLFGFALAAGLLAPYVFHLLTEHKARREK